jgi:hypothetical protein
LRRRRRDRTEQPALHRRARGQQGGPAADAYHERGDRHHGVHARRHDGQLHHRRDGAEQQRDGGATENAGVIVPLNPVAAQTSGRIATGSFTAANITAAGVSFDSLLVLMRNGNSYVNVHTVNHPAGEVRGQVQTVP